MDAREICREGLEPKEAKSSIVLDSLLLKEVTFRALRTKVLSSMIRRESVAQLNQLVDTVLGTKLWRLG